jgi:conjugative relaxase-like TrwC/TraI family protein
LIFSASKSPSVLAALVPARVRHAMLAAHDEAVAVALRYLADSAVHVRGAIAGERIMVGEGLIAVVYVHRMSRALDPQPHRHAVAANLARSVTTAEDWWPSCGPNARSR